MTLFRRLPDSCSWYPIIDWRGAVPSHQNCTWPHEQTVKITTVPLDLSGPKSAPEMSAPEMSAPDMRMSGRSFAGPLQRRPIDCGERTFVMAITTAEGCHG